MHAPARLFWPLIALTVVALLVATCAVLERQPVDDTPPLLLISIDGFRHDYLDMAALPALHRLVDEGLRADSLMHIFPTKTFATHYALVTGLYAEGTGVVANNMWDPERESSFSLRDRDAVGDGYWYEGEPIWNSVEKAGKIAATYFWPGSEAQIGGMRPTIWKPYAGDTPHDERIDQVLEWLDLPPGRRPSFLTLYFSAVDSAGHRYGPGQPETIEAMQEVDRALGRLLDGLAARGLLGRMHVLVTSDHGMTEIDLDRYVLLDEYLELDQVRVSDWGPAGQIWTIDGGPDADAILDALADAPNLTAWKKGEAPERLHFTDHKRVPDVTVLGDPGWMISNKPYYAGALRGLLGGMHGWDPAWRRMQGIFIAHGPAFAPGSRLPAVRSVDLYSLMAELMNVPPAETAGALTAFEPLLYNDAPAAVEQTLWDCADRRFEVRVTPGLAALHAGEQVFALPANEAASGARYADTTTLFWNQGESARFEIDGTTWTDCLRVVH